MFTALKMKSILVVQFRNKPELIESERASLVREAGEEVSFAFVNALDKGVDWSKQTLSLEKHNALVLGGSGEFDFDGGRAPDDEQRKVSHGLLQNMKPFLTYVFEHDFPTFGICFGHQIIGAFRGARVLHDHNQKKVGTFDVAIVPEQRELPIFKGIAPTFTAQYGHKDSLDALPQGAQLLVSGDRCHWSGLRYSDHIYTVQFHPEMNADDVRFRLENTPGYLPEGADVDDVVRESPHATQILKNFFAHIVQ